MKYKKIKPKIGLFDVDSMIPNLALMKISAYYKEWPIDVEFYSPLFHNEYWAIYASKVFNYPHPNDAYLRNDMILGGPGFYFSEKFKKNFHVFKELQEEFEHIYPDYELYHCDYAMGYIIKGCIRNCPWCIVPKMDPYQKSFARWINRHFYKFQTWEEYISNKPILIEV